MEEHERELRAIDMDGDGGARVETYRVDTTCQNCGDEWRIDVPKGTPAAFGAALPGYACRHCECVSLHRKVKVAAPPNIQRMGTGIAAGLGALGRPLTLEADAELARILERRGTASAASEQRQRELSRAVSDQWARVVERQQAADVLRQEQALMQAQEHAQPPRNGHAGQAGGPAPSSPAAGGAGGNADNNVVRSPAEVLASPASDTPRLSGCRGSLDASTGATPHPTATQ
jgi:hypothetical protein